MNRDTAIRVERGIYDISIMLAMFFLSALAVTFPGCDQPRGTTPPVTAPNTVQIDGHTITAQPGANITVRKEQSQGSSIEKQKGSASGVGAGLQNGGKEVAGGFDASAPSAQGSGWLASGGASKIKFTALGGSETSPLMWAGIACVLGAGVAFYFGLRRAALIAGLAGGSLIVASMLPQWAFIIIALAGAGVLVFYVYSERQAKASTELAKSFAWARKDMPADVRAQFDKFLDPHLNKQGAIDDTKTLAALQAKEGMI